jgi:hypothetical protein
LLPAGFELVPDLSRDPFAVPEFPEFPNEASKKKGSEDGSAGDVTKADAKDAKATDDAGENSADAELEARSTRKASDPAKDLEAFKNSLDDFHVFDRAPARSGGSDESKETNNADADDETENARPGAWITVEELSDDPFAEPEWRGDDDALVKAQVEQMLAAKRDERRAAGDAAADDEAAAAEAKAEEKQKRRFEMEEAKREAEAEEEETKSTATIEADDSYDGVAEDDDDR